MFIIDLISFIFLTLIIILSLSGLGQIFAHDKSNNFFTGIFFGFISISFLITILHFFIEINIYISLSILILGLIFGLKNVSFFSKITKKEKIIYILIFLVLVPIYISQKYHEDFGYYHLPYIINVVNEKIVFGLANANRAFVHNSIWLNILPAFYFKGNYNFVSLPSFIIYLTFIIFSINQIINNEKKISSYFLIVSIFYLILKFTRISEFGNDIPAIIFSVLSIYFFFKFNEEKKPEKKNSYFFYNFSFAIFAILIKFSSIPVFILTFYLFYKNYKILIKNILKPNYLTIFCLGIIFFLQQFFYTGCFIFPSKITCVDVSWFDQYFLTSKYRLELVNKSYFATARDILTEEEYLKNFNWVPYWFNRNYTGILEHLITMIFPLLFFLLLLRKKENKDIFNFKIEGFFIIFIILGFLFWFNFSPVYRFGIVYFLGLVFFVTFFIFKNRSFSKKIFLNFILIMLIFNFSKNITRIVNEEKIFFGIKKIDNSYKNNTSDLNNIIKVYMPDMEANAEKGNGWQGRLCWDIKFLCTKNKVIIDRNMGYLIIKKKRLIFKIRAFIKYYRFY